MCISKRNKDLLSLDSTKTGLSVELGLVFGGSVAMSTLTDGYSVRQDTQQVKTDLL